MTHFLNKMLIPAAAAVALVAAAASAQQTFTNSSSISVPHFGAAAPYPSQINVAGGPTSINTMTVTLTDFSHTSPIDISVMLVGPTGAKTILLGRVGGGNPVVNATLVFRDGATLVPTYGPFVVGEIAPSLNDTFPQTFNAPAPSTPTSASLGAFTGTNPNGTWSLYVQDFAGGDAGSIAGGWSIALAGVPAPALDSSFTYQGRLESAAEAVNGNADFRFSLWTTETNTSPDGQAGNTVSRRDVPVTDGLFTTSLDFGFGVADNKNLFLQTEVRSPAGSGAYTTLTPRQPLTATPNAHFARKAKDAENAALATNAIAAFTAATAVNVPWTGLTGQAQVPTGSIGSGWQLLLNNTDGFASNYRGGFRLGDSGYLEATSQANLPTPNFARLINSGVWTAVSDARLKSDITHAEGNLAAALKLNPVNFRWKESGAADFGLIAQEVRAVLPQLVNGDERLGMLTVNYSQLSVVAIGAIQELKAENDQLKSRLEKIEAMLNAQAAK